MLTDVSASTVKAFVVRGGVTPAIVGRRRHRVRAVRQRRRHRHRPAAITGGRHDAHLLAVHHHRHR
ncbi:hypothetical protein ACLESO_28865, partial [Pyxidicoccus sp. 3LG]